MIQVNRQAERPRLTQVMAGKPGLPDFRRKPDAMWYLVAIALVMALLAYLLWMPIELRIDSAKGLACLRLGILAKASLEPEPGQGVRLHLRAGFLDFYWGPADFHKAPPQKPGGRQKAKRRKGPKITPEKALRLIRSFRVRYFRWDLDTGNPVLNARLYPAFYLLDRTLGGFGINFQDHNRLALRVVNRPLRILRAFV